MGERSPITSDLSFGSWQRGGEWHKIAKLKKSGTPRPTKFSDC
jgi:hypothetical protein